ncbi:MAG TPA: hypothetical protein VN032_10515 [Thermoanaerobaculia bacterium]|nr:hypothetical protein [Thermoanaerobaculia bacterium]
MTMTRALSATALATALLLAAAPARAGHHGGGNVSIHDDGDPASCSDIRVEFDDRPGVRAEERLTFAADAGKPLRVHVPEHSGASVHGTDRADFEVLVCKAAPSKAGLDAISVSRESGTLSVRGPSGDWVGYLIIHAPKGAAMELSADNGPIALSGLSGRVTVRSENGPISVTDSAGDIDARAENGPISARGDGGKLRLSTENGPIAVALSGSAWKGEGFDARAVNGPVTLAVPAGYRSGTSVESLGHSPFSCRGDACGGVRRTWDDDHKKLELGAGPVIVRLSTENGPVAVKTGGRLDEDEED